jgi:hypothetical protein
MIASHWPKVTDPADPIASKLNALPQVHGSGQLAQTLIEHEYRRHHRDLRA